MPIPAQFIDVHTHTFTAAMIPGRAILEKTFGLPKWLAVPVADLITALSVIAEKIEVSDASATQGLIQALRKASLASAEHARIEALNSLAAEVAQLAMKGKLDLALLTPLLQLPGREARGFTPVVLERAFITESILHVIHLLELELGKVESILETYFDDLLFVFHLILTQQDNARAVKEAYGELGYQQTPINVLMMDMEKAYAETPYHSWAEEVEMNGQLQGLPDVSGFVGFDPRRDDSVAVVRAVMGTRQFRGVKVYPGLGYKPNDDYSTLRELYEFCSLNDVPILTHCTPQGWEVTKEVTGLNSNPVYWDTVLRQYPNLRLCYGHAGGGGATVKETPYPGWNWPWYSTCEPQNHYAKQVLEHCNKYENVYCDFSYYDQLMLGAECDVLQTQFVANLRDVLRETPLFGRKIMFGSDYHMPSLTHRVKEYFLLWSELFEDEVLKTFKSAFFYDNARSFLKLG